MFPEVKPEVIKGYVDKFVRLFMQSIYKWVQSPLSLHVGNLDLDRERGPSAPRGHPLGLDEVAPIRCPVGPSAPWFATAVHGALFMAWEQVREQAAMELLVHGQRPGRERFGKRDGPSGAAVRLVEVRRAGGAAAALAVPRARRAGGDAS